jgi:hypothetical protein
MTKACIVCARPFICRNAYAKYCSDACEQRQRRRRNLPQALARERERRRQGQVSRSKHYLERNRAYYHRHKPEARERKFEWKIRTLPASVQDMRRVLRRFKQWCKARGLTMRQFLEQGHP